MSIEAALRDDSGAVVGYGRTAAAAELAAGATITLPVRRPIVYFAGPSLTFTPPATIVWHGATDDVQRPVDGRRARRLDASSPTTACSSSRRGRSCS